MKWFFSFGFFLLLFPLQASFAAEDFIAPTKISFTVQPGETFSYDLLYKSGIGGVYDLSSRVFRYTESGAKEFVSESSDLVFYEQNSFEFKPGDELKIPLKIVLPAEISQQDIYISHFLRRRTEEQQTFELGSLMYLRIGDPPAFSGKVSNVQFQKREATEQQPGKGFYSITFDFENTAGRYFAVTPKIRISDRSGKLLNEVENQSTYVFPEFKRTVNVFNFTNADISFTDSQTALVVHDENNHVLHEEALTLQEDDVFLAQARKESPFSGIPVRKGILYNPIFQISAIVIGLTLIVFSFFMKRP